MHYFLYIHFFHFISFYLSFFQFFASFPSFLPSVLPSFLRFSHWHSTPPPPPPPYNPTSSSRYVCPATSTLAEALQEYDRAAGLEKGSTGYCNPPLPPYLATHALRNNMKGEGREDFLWCCCCYCYCFHCLLLPLFLPPLSQYVFWI